MQDVDLEGISAWLLRTDDVHWYEQGLPWR
jgi:hypothetical protein